MKKLEVVAAAVFDSLDMMGMLVFLLVLALVLFSTLIYFCEKGAWVYPQPSTLNHHPSTLTPQPSPLTLNPEP